MESKTKQVNVFRIYNKRPAKITINVPVDTVDDEAVEITKENFVAVEYLDDTFKKAFDPKVQQRIKAEISDEAVVRLPRRAKKELKKSVGINNGVNKVRLIRKTMRKTATGFSIQLRRQNAKNK